jgi:hypothetical protein
VPPLKIGNANIKPPKVVFDVTPFVTIGMIVSGVKLPLGNSPILLFAILNYE